MTIRRVVGGPPFRSGSIVPFADLFAPAIRYASDGYAVSPIVAGKWAAAVEALPHELGFAEHFMPQGRAPRAGEVFRCPPMARTLEQIAATHGHAFYRGELAEAMVAHAKANGALHTMEDFAAHTLDWVAPLALDYGGATVHEIPPNGQGIAALMALGILRGFDLKSLPPDSIESQHLQIEAMKLAFADAYRYVSDPRTMEFSPGALLDPEQSATSGAGAARSTVSTGTYPTPPGSRIASHPTRWSRTPG
jgi:gamma-glutamyltranspeptidase/glutathione hydrolase